MSKQRSTLSKERNFNTKLVRHCCRFWQQSRTLLPHCCWCGRALSGIRCRRVSVRLSVCLSHTGIVSKRLNVESRKQRHSVMVMTQQLTTFLTAVYHNAASLVPSSSAHTPVISRACSCVTQSGFICTPTTSKRMPVAVSAMSTTSVECASDIAALCSSRLVCCS